MGKLDRRAGREGWLARPRHWALAAALAIFCVQAPPQAWAHDPSEPEADWYNSLKTANDGISCCSMSHDCGEVGDDYKPGAEPGSYWVWWRGGWAYVPPYAVLKRSDNPTGHPVACMHYLDGEPIARCFVRPTEG